MTAIYEKNIAYANSMADWLQSQPWQHFFTMTSKYELTLKSARRLVERFDNRAKKMVYRGGDSRTFWVAEKYELKDGFHLHGLLNYDTNIFPAENGYEVLTETYQIVSGARKSGGHNRVQFSKYNKERSAGMYCAKYLLKGCSDYDIM